MAGEALNLSLLQEAQKVVFQLAHRTPVFSCSTIDSLCGTKIWFKAENFQKTGSFKFRGASFALSKLSPQEKGVVACSSGNHGQAVSLAARLQGKKALVVMPKTAPKVKVQAVKSYGGQVELYDPETTDREELAHHLVQVHGYAFIHPFDNPLVIAGQSTAAWELLEEHPEIEELFVPCGGGGLLSGSALTLRFKDKTKRKIFGVEPEKADKAYQALKQGKIVTLKNAQTIADGLKPPAVGKLTFPLIQSLVEEMFRVPEEDIAKALMLLWERAKLLVEPSAAVPLALLLGKNRPKLQGPVGVILSGGNADFPPLSRWLEEKLPR